MQERLDNLSGNARRVHAYLAAIPDRTETLEVIAKSVGLTAGETEGALRELEQGRRAAQSFGGWPVLT
jgi:predicted Rossmann fold nucleotide-binding protein DprA/Smf involved in DNA uptake